MDELEKLFRIPPETKGIVYRPDKIVKVHNYFLNIHKIIHGLDTLLIQDPFRN